MEHPDAPPCRAAIRDGTVTLHRWTRALAGHGPAPAGIVSVRAALADLRLIGDRELLVTPVRGAPWDAAAEETLLGWARRVGYRRVWLPSRVVDFGDALAELGRAHVVCPTCGAEWEDETLAFWEDVRRQGWFPPMCRACGGSLPEWSTAVSDPPVRARPLLRKRS